MRAQALLLLATAMVAFGGNKDDGLFIADEAREGRVAIEDGEIVVRQPATRLEPSKVVFRPDTEGPKIYWLEIHLGVYADPGDYYLFTIKGKQYAGFVVRPLDQRMKTCKWALGFKDPAAGRALLKLIAATYDLGVDRAIDRTQANKPAHRIAHPLCR